MRNDKKYTVKMNDLLKCITEANKNGQRFGQYVVNNLLPHKDATYHEDITSLFYAPNSDFWEKATKALDIR